MLRRSSLSVSPCFLWECLTNPTVSPFPAPATSNGACGFPALRSLVRFATSFMRPPWPAMLSGADLMVSLYSTFANRFCLLLVVYPRPQVLQITGRFYHGAPASRGGQGVTVQQGSFAPWELPQFIATTNPSATLSSSTDFPGFLVIRLPAPPISRRDEEGFSSCSTCPCHRAAPTTPPECLAASVSLRRSMLPSPRGRGLGLQIYCVSGPLMGLLALRPGDSLTIPWMALSVGFIRFVSSTNATQATGP